MVGFGLRWISLHEDKTLWPVESCETMKQLVVKPRTVPLKNIIYLKKRASSGWNHEVIYSRVGEEFGTLVLTNE